jgi:hypothetical protein
MRTHTKLAMVGLATVLAGCADQPTAPVSERCSVVPGTEVEVDVPAGNTVPVAFEVTCSTGASITVRTTGLDFDSDGYLLEVDASDRGVIGVNGSPRVIDLDPGSHTIGLRALAPNCAFDGSGSRTVTIVAAEVAPVEFAVVCTATSGVIGAVISGGSALTFEATVDGVTRFMVGSTGRAYLTGVPAGDHVVSLSGPPNCSVETSPQSVTVTAGTLVRDTVEVTFSATCVSGFQITTSTTGPIAGGRYNFYLSNNAYCDWPIAGGYGEVARNGTLLLQVETGRYWACLGGIPGNCRVTAQDPPDPIQFVRGSFVEVKFRVECS